MAILPGESNRSISPIIDGIIAALCQDIEVLGVRFHISASAGAAVYPNDGDTSEEIFKNADNAMYAAKRSGKNCWRFYEATMQAEAYEKMLLTNSLHHAIERGELLLHYQPQISVNSGAVVRLALDDFGTGYSSLTYLQHLPVTTLKIDKSFIEMIPVMGTRKAIIGNVVNMAHTMEMTVVAEGVETQEQFDYLALCGCDYIQGYLFSRPVPEEEVVKFLPIRFTC